MREERPGVRALVFGVQPVAVAAIALLAFLSVLAGREAWLDRLAALACAAALAGGHLVWFAHGRIGRRAVVLACQAALGLVPLLQFGAPWSPASGFFAAGLLLAFPPSRGAPAALTACVAAGLGSAWPGGGLHEAVTGAVTAGVTALTLFGLGTAMRLVAERDVEVRELKRQAIAEERKQFSRDLHDLLGLSLSAITLKGELVDRLVPTRPAQAKEELAELLVMSRRALADVRTISAGYRQLSLEQECRAAADVLSAAGTRVTVARSGVDDLPPRVATALVAALREGVTNVVRHSTASWCALSVSAEDGTAWLEIVNDGADGTAGYDVDSGAGLRNLRDRLDVLNGTLTTETAPDGTHRLLVAIPLARVAS